MRTKCDMRRMAFIQCAAELVREKGVENASMDNIVARLGGSKATLYNYFPSKDALLKAVLAHCALTQLGEVFRLLDPQQPLRAMLQDFAHKFLAELLAPDVLATLRLAQQDAERCDMGREFYEAGPKRGWTMVAEFLQAHMQAGHLRQADPWVAALHLRGLLESELLGPRLLGVIDTVSAEEIDAAANRALDVYLRGYAPD